MKKLIVSLVIGAVSATLSSGAFAQTRDDHKEFNDRIHQINDDAKKTGVDLKRALHTISVETGVPQDRVESMHAKNRDVGVAGIMVACVLANETKRPPEDFIDSHLKSNKAWAAMADDHKVSLAKVNDRLERLQHSLAREGSAVEERREERRRK